MVFLHGLFGQGRNWTTVAKALADHARVMLVDLPNHGRSAVDRPLLLPGHGRPGGRPAASATAAATAYAVVGHSMGGKVAMTLALHHPELVARLAVVDVSPVPTSEISHFARYVEGMRSIDLATLADRSQADAAPRAVRTRSRHPQLPAAEPAPGARPRRRLALADEPRPAR